MYTDEFGVYFILRDIKTILRILNIYFNSFDLFFPLEISSRQGQLVQCIDNVHVTYGFAKIEIIRRI